MEEEYMTKADVTARLKLKDIRTVDNLIRRGKLKAIKIGRLYRVLKSSFDELVSKTI